MCDCVRRSVRRVSSVDTGQVMVMIRLYSYTNMIHFLFHVDHARSMNRQRRKRVFLIRFTAMRESATNAKRLPTDPPGQTDLINSSHIGSRDAHRLSNSQAPSICAPRARLPLEASSARPLATLAPPRGAASLVEPPERAERGGAAAVALGASVPLRRRQEHLARPAEADVHRRREPRVEHLDGRCTPGCGQIH